jgi:glyoxylase-like metal-dependent hydrolase (beta-lactamase superfamily II)
MLGDIKELKKNLWLVKGDNPKNVLKSPTIASSVLYKAEDRLYLMDSGVGPVFRQSLKNVIEQAYPISEFYLLNSHLHVDNICNNNIIEEVQAQKKHHYVSDAGFASLDSYVFDSLITLSEYYDIFSGYSFPYNMKLLSYRLRSALQGKKKGYRAYVGMSTKKYLPIHTSRHTMQPLELHPDYEVDIGEVPWKGWDLRDLDVLEVRGHAPDELIFYIPEHKFLFAADLTYELIPMWPTTHLDRSLQAIENCLAMASAGEIEILVDSHHDEISDSPDKVVTMLEKMLSNHNRFSEVMHEIMEAAGSLTVAEMYKRIKSRQDDPAVIAHFERDFPHSPYNLRAFICTLMMQLGWPSKGKLGKKSFSLPSEY